MADIVLVIKISEKAYNALTHTEFDANLVVDEMRKSIVNGTPLPKGHGRLIDADTLEPRDMSPEPWYSPMWGFELIDIEDAPTIIEADKAESE